MKTNIIKLLIVLALFAGVHQLAAQGTAFTYQGRLNDGTNPATGIYDFQFQVFDAAAAGNSYGTPATNSFLGVGVTNGLFNVTLDFGPQIFSTGASRWLQTSVRTNNTITYTNLSPRQPLLTTPYAIYAESAGIASSVSSAAITASALNTVGSPSIGQVLSYNGSAMSWTTPSFTLPYSSSASSSSSIFTLQNTGSGPAGAFLGNVGIGTTTPMAELQIYGNSAPGPNIPSTEAVLSSGDGYHNGYMSTTGDAAVTLDMWNGAYGEVSTYDYSAGTALPLVLNSNGGNVGIGTTTPGARLDVVTSSNTSVAVRGTNVYSGVYGQLAVSDTKGLVGDFYQNAYIGVYGNDGITASSYFNGDYAGYFDGNVNVSGNESVNGNETVGGNETVNGNVTLNGTVNGNVNVNGQVAASSIRSPGAGINTATFAFTQQAVSGNTQGNGTMIYNSLCDGDPNAILIITHNWGADTNSTSKLNTKPVGVYYNGPHWVIFNEDNSTMALGRAFNVLIVKP